MIKMYQIIIIMLIIITIIIMANLILELKNREVKNVT